MVIDVYIPCAGSGEFFAESLRSVLGQTHREIIVHVIENAVPHEVYRDICATHPDVRVRWHRFETRLRMTENWQRCLTIGEAPFFAFLHDDDVWPLDYLSTALQKFAEMPSATACLTSSYGRTFQPGEKIEPLQAAAQARLAFLDGLPEPVRSLAMGVNNIAHMSALLCRRRSLGFPIENDWLPDQRFLAAQLAFGLVACNLATNVEIRQHANSLTAALGPSVNNQQEYYEHVRSLLIWLRRNRGLTGAQIVPALPALPSEYLETLLLCCFFLPLRLPLVELGCEMLREAAIRAALRRRILAAPFWPLHVLLGIWIQYRLFSREKAQRR